MENKKVIKFAIVALFTVSIQLISIYAVPENSEQIVTETPTINKTSSIASLNIID